VIQRDRIMIVFAYDGSLHGGWVAHYAIRFASRLTEPRLRLVHVDDGAIGAIELERRIARIAEEARLFGVRFEAEVVARGGLRVVDHLLAMQPEEGVLVSGMRSRPRHQALLAGTVSAGLLATARLPVVALRVMHPGLLGQPSSVLLPLAERPASGRRAIPMLRLLGPELRQLHLLCVSEVPFWRHPLVSAAGAARRLGSARACVMQVEREIEQALEPRRLEMDASLVVSTDVAREIVLASARLRSHLVCLGASERSRSARLLGTPIERVLHAASCDVAVYRSRV
jgi:nucleotide-binding universal stress UspA family protein